MVLKTTGSLLALILTLTCTSASSMSTSTGVCIKLSKAGTGVRVDVSGSGIVIDGQGGNPGGTQNFNNFTTGNPFITASAGFPNGVKTLSQSLFVKGFEDNDLMKPYSVELSTINLTTNANPDKSDISFSGLGGFSIQTGDSFIFSGSALILGLDFDSLIPGTYYASNTIGDAEEFGGATLKIASVPEPATLTLAAIGGTAVFVRRRRVAKSRRSHSPSS